MKLPLLPLFLLFLSLHQTAQSQCNLEPTVMGETLLCPNSTALLTTQEYDSYQWYKREFLNGVPEMIPGATGQTLAINENDVLYYFWVEVAYDTCTAISPEVLVDGYAFLPPFVEHTGEYTFDPNTESFVICAGDTMFLTLGQPYDTNITWYNNGNPIAGNMTKVLAITGEGAYTVEAAPAVCPDFLQPLGLVINVTVENCSTGTKPETEKNAVKIFPNPAGQVLNVYLDNHTAPAQVEVLDCYGHRLGEWKVQGDQFSLPLENYAPGVYFVKYSTGGSVSTLRFLKS